MSRGRYAAFPRSRKGDIFMYLNGRLSPVLTLIQLPVRRLRMATVEEALQQATASADAGRPDIAENVYRAILAKFPQNVQAQDGLRAALAMQGKTSGGANAPSQQDIQALIALYNSGNVIEAEARARVLTTQFPSALILHNVLGAALLDQGKHHGAVECFQKALELEPSAAEGYNNLGIALQRSGATEDAVACFQEAVVLKPDYPDAHNNLGVALNGLGRTSEAISSYQDALTHAPDYAEAHNNLGAALAEQGETDQAILCYQHALQYNPDYAEAHNNLGIILQKKQLWDDALTSFEQALKITPRYAAAYNNLGSALQELGRLDEALESYQNALDVVPGLPQTLNNIGNVYRLLDRFDDAISTFIQFLEANPDNAEAHNNLGVVYKELGKTSDAKACYRRALELKPNFVDARLNLGSAYFSEERIEDAIECYRAADPKNESAKISSLLLECYYRKDDKIAYNIQLQLIKAQQNSFNFRAAAAAAFVAHQHGTENHYKFCDDPIANIVVFNLLEDGAIDEECIDGLHDAVNNSGGNERFAPGPVSAGYHSIGNLFIKGIRQFDETEIAIRHYIDKYHAMHKDERSLFIENWPQEYALDGWYIRLKQGGEIAAHIHSAWLSGVLYLKVPDKNGGGEGNIEFTLRGYDLPVLRDDFPRKMVETFPGALVLFPSSLPHRVIQFTSDEERICIAFDAVPM